MTRVSVLTSAMSSLAALLLLCGLGSRGRSFVPLLLRSEVQPRVSETDVDAYRRDGVVHLRGAFSPAWVSYMREAFKDAMTRPSPSAEFYMSNGDFSANPSREGMRERDVDFFMDHVFFEGAKGRTPGWSTVARSSPAAAIMAALMGSATAAYFYSQLIQKRGGASNALPWHQDLPYWKIDGQQIGTVWVALDAMPAAAGVRYIRGSHRWELPHPDAPPEQLAERLVQEGAEALVFDVAPGDAICFDARVVHGSPANPAGPDENHRRVALRFGGDDAIYFERPGHTPIPTPEVDRVHGLRSGDPLACSAFPRVYRRCQ